MPGIKGIYKALKSRRLAGKISTVRRIDRVAPPPGKRVVAITFDDGPTVAPARPSQDPITPTILDTLKAYGARATFDVIGTTQYRYPDRQGSIGGAYWNGVYHDHYPEFGCDSLAGAVSQPDLVRRIADEGHEISNHGMTHTAFGPQYYPYMNRRYLPGYDAVLRDIYELHDLIYRLTGEKMRLGRPAHYIDKTADGYDAYDVYAQVGYLYMGASFDGGGWQASCGDFSRDVDAMVARLETALELDPSSLNGQIIFHKDGYNMSAEAPAVFGLKRQMEILKKYEYRVVSVSELVAESEFTDIGPDHPVYPAASLLARNGYPVAFADNCVRPDDVTSVGEIAKMLVPALSSPSGSDGSTTTANQMIVNALLFRPEGGFRLFPAKGSVSLSAFVDACRRMVEAVPMSDDARLGRLSLLSERSELGSSEFVTRGQLISFLAAALFGE